MPDLTTIQEFGVEFTAEEWDDIQEQQNRYYLELMEERAADQGEPEEMADFYELQS